jgi:tetratricopeptide (TPR) repeat protein
VEDRVLQSVVGLLGLQLRPGERVALLARGTSKPAAYDFYLRGRGYLQEYERPENLDSAITVFRNALKDDPKYALAYAGLGEAYLHQYEQSRNADRVRQAQESCKQAIALADALANGHICLGMVYNGTGQYENAVEEFRRAVQLDPTSDDGFTGLAHAYERLGRSDDAEKTYLRAIELRPQYWGGYAWLGGLYFRQARYQDAARMYTEMIALAPDSFRGYSNLGGIYLFQGRYSDAIPQFQRSVSIYPTGDAYSNLGVAYFLQGSYSDAARTYEKAAEVGSNATTAYVVWGNLAEAYYWAPGERDRAFPIYRKAITLAREQLRVNAREVQALEALALYSAAVGEKQAALDYLQRALQQAPLDPDVLFNAGKVNAELGERSRALQFLQDAVKTGYSVFFVRDDPAFRILANDMQFRKLVHG